MKKTKLFTSLSPLALVFSLGACGSDTEDTFSEDNEPTSSETTPETDTSENTSDDNTSLGEVDGQYEDNMITEMLDAIEEDCSYNATSYYYLYQSDYLEEPASVTMSAVQRFGRDVYATEDAIIFEYPQYTTGSSGPGWHYMDIEPFVNDYENGTCDYYTLNSYTSAIYDLEYVELNDGAWKDTIWSLADLAEYKSAFTISDTDYDVIYGSIKEYGVEEEVYDMHITMVYMAKSLILPSMVVVGIT